MADIKVKDLPTQAAPSINDYTITDNAAGTATEKTLWSTIRDLFSANQEITFTLSAAELIFLNTIPKVVIASPGAGKLIVVDSCEIEETFGTTAYGAGLSINLITDTATVAQWTSSVINATISKTIKMVQSVINAGGASTQLIANKSVKIQILAVDPVVGDGTMKGKIRYRIINSPF